MRVAKIVQSTLTKQIRFSNIFAKVPMAPPDPVLGIQVAYNNDSDARKVNLGVGAYRDDDLKPVVFKVVRKIEEQLVADKSLNMVLIFLCRNIFLSMAFPDMSQEVRNSSSAKILLSLRKAEYAQLKLYQELVL